MLKRLDCPPWDRVRLKHLDACALTPRRAGGAFRWGRYAKGGKCLVSFGHRVRFSSLCLLGERFKFCLRRAAGWAYFHDVQVQAPGDRLLDWAHEGCQVAGIRWQLECLKFGRRPRRPAGCPASAGAASESKCGMTLNVNEASHLQDAQVILSNIETNIPQYAIEY